LEEWVDADKKKEVIVFWVGALVSKQQKPRLIPSLFLCCSTAT